ncbi:MAG: pilus assembly protein PilM, partial [Verrucomicrobiota bacterium]|nr:pilus assembly protein PilM [Verrucomicrobiota bacterium]
MRARDGDGAWNVRLLRTLDEAVPLVSAQDDVVLSLPVAAILAQRFRLPTVDPAEFPEMVRIQIEKALPFSAEEVTTDFELIEQNETDSVISAIAVRNERLAEIAAPLLDKGIIPRQVTVYAAQRATT